MRSPPVGALPTVTLPGENACHGLLKTRTPATDTSLVTLARIALYSVDPPALDFFHAFDPDTFSVTSAIHDALIYIDADGSVQPGLATAWRQVDSVTWELELRQGVTFHDGSPFSADDVIATLRAHFEPTASAAGNGILSILAGFEALGPYLVRIRTHVPDALFVHRLFCSHISPAHVLRSGGRDALAAHPIGTGAYRFVAWERNAVIHLQRNPDHWARRATVDQLELVIAPQKEWVERLQNGSIDVALNLDTFDANRLRASPGIHVDHAPAALSHWFLLTTRGPLADDRVRRAMNHAVHRGLLVDVAERGHGIPQRSIATSEQEGYASDVEPYSYDPELARRVLAEAGYPTGFTLRGLVSETSSAVYLISREFLGRVGVKLEAEVVPRCEWMARVGPNTSPEIDFAVANVDNPVVHSLFHHFVLLFSRGAQTILRDAEYDARFLATAVVTEPEAALRAQQELEHYVAQRALILFTVQSHVYLGARDGFTALLPRSGHFDTALFWGLAADSAEPPPKPLLRHPTRTAPSPDLERLMSGTSQQGIFYLPPSSSDFVAPEYERVWRNILAAQERWEAQVDPMLRELVAGVEAASALASVLGSTNRVGIVGIAVTGRLLFVNQGYAQFVAHTDTNPAEIVGIATWNEARAMVDAQGSWTGRVAIAASARAARCPAELMLTVTGARDSHDDFVGYTLVFADFSGEEERIRSGAVHMLLDHVPYGILVSDRHGRVGDASSRACVALLKSGDRPLKGRLLVELFGLSVEASHFFQEVYDQVFEDVLPETVTLRLIPSKVQLAGRHLSVQASLIRNGEGKPDSMLFSILDVTAQILAEAENERIMGVMSVLRHRKAFARFVSAAFDTGNAVAREGQGGRHLDLAWQELARRELHTWKGVLGQFALLSAMRELHAIEEEETITPEHVAAGLAIIGRLVEANRDVWRLDETRAVVLSQDSLDALRNLAAGQRTADELRAELHRFLGAHAHRPLGELLGPMEEAVARMAARRGKRVDFAVSGGDVPIPLEVTPVVDILNHLVRNAIDHGIEPVDARGNKPRVGRIGLAAARDATSLVIEISDDGAGIDVDRVVARAVETGAISRAAVSEMTADERIRLIFREGVSTAAKVDESSGRGVGLAAVAAQIKSLGGDLRVSTVMQTGTTFRLKIPLETG